MNYTKIVINEESDMEDNYSMLSELYKGCYVKIHNRTDGVGVIEGYIKSRYRIDSASTGSYYSIFISFLPYNSGLELANDEMIEIGSKGIASIPISTTWLSCLGFEEMKIENNVYGLNEYVIEGKKFYEKTLRIRYSHQGIWGIWYGVSDQYDSITSVKYIHQLQTVFLLMEGNQLDAAPGREPFYGYKPNQQNSSLSRGRRK